MQGKDIAISAYGQIWLISDESKLLYQVVEEMADPEITDVKRISVGRDDVYILSSSNTISRYYPY